LFGELLRRSTRGQKNLSRQSKDQVCVSVLIYTLPYINLLNPNVTLFTNLVIIDYASISKSHSMVFHVQFSHRLVHQKLDLISQVIRTGGIFNDMIEIVILIKDTTFISLPLRYKFGLISRPYFGVLLPIETYIFELQRVRYVGVFREPDFFGQRRAHVRTVGFVTDDDHLHRNRISRSNYLQDIYHHLL
jgi:hypothetical protein